MRTALCLAVGVTAAAASAFADDNTTDEHHQLEEIVVTATPLRRTVETLAQPTAVLSGDALARKQAASIGETIANELGVSATYFGPVASRPVIRGQFGERVDVLSNGLSSLDASALSEDHAVALDNHLAERIEIVRGPATLLYGSGAAGGIVNVIDSRIHEQALDAPLSGALSLGTDSAIGKTAGALRIDAGTENIIGHLDYSRISTDNINIPGFAEGFVSVQDEAAQLVGELIAPRPGERVLDACAGRGGKTGHMAQCMLNRGELIAIDSRHDRVKDFITRLRPVGSKLAHEFRLDAVRDGTF